MLFPSVGGYNFKTRKHAIVEYLDYQIPVTQLKGPKGNGDVQAAKRDYNAPPTGSRWQPFFLINR